MTDHRHPLRRPRRRRRPLRPDHRPRGHPRRRPRPGRRPAPRHHDLPEGHRPPPAHHGAHAGLGARGAGPRRLPGPQGRGRDPARPDRTRAAGVPPRRRRARRPRQDEPDHLRGRPPGPPRAGAARAPASSSAARSGSGSECIDLVQHDDGVTVRAHGAGGEGRRPSTSPTRGTSWAPTAPRAPCAGWPASACRTSATRATTSPCCSGPTSPSASPAERYALHMVVDGDELRSSCRPGPTVAGCTTVSATPSGARPPPTGPRSARSRRSATAAGVPDLEVEVLGSLPVVLRRRGGDRDAGRAGLPRRRRRPPHHAARRDRHEHRDRRRPQPRLEARLGGPWAGRRVAARTLRRGALPGRAAQRAGLPGGVLAGADATDLSHDFGVVYASSAASSRRRGDRRRRRFTEDGAVVVRRARGPRPHAWVSHAGRAALDPRPVRRTADPPHRPRGHAGRRLVTAAAGRPGAGARDGRQRRPRHAGELERATGSATTDAVLVRPDGHVAWRLAADDHRGLRPRPSPPPSAASRAVTV